MLTRRSYFCLRSATLDWYSRIDLFVEYPEHLLFERAARRQIENKDVTRLADAVDAPDALLDGHRVPGQIEIDQRVAELEVAPLASRLGADQQRDLTLKSPNSGVLFRPRHPALELLAGDAFALNQFGQPMQCLAVMDEDHLLFIRIASQQFDERLLFAARRDAGVALLQLPPFEPFAIAIARFNMPRYRAGRGGSGRAGGREQVTQRHPLLRSSFAVRFSDKAGQLQITGALLVGRIYPQSRRMARRQFDVDQRARFANHYVAHQVTHLVFIGRRARFAAGHITAAKLLFSFEDSRLEKRQQVVKLDKRVLNGSRREQQQKAFVESVDRLPVR